MNQNPQYKSFITNIIKHIGVIFLYASVLTIGMLGGGMAWTMLASDQHYLIDFCALSIGYALTFKTNLEMYELSRYLNSDLRGTPKISWKTQRKFIIKIITITLIIIPIKICANIFYNIVLT